SWCGPGFGRLQEAPEGLLHRWRGSFLDDYIDWPRRASAGFPFAVSVLEPENLFQSVSDGEAAVGRAFRHNSLGPQVHRKVGPIVFASNQRIPRRAKFVLPGTILRH